MVVPPRLEVFREAYVEVGVGVLLRSFVDYVPPVALPIDGAVLLIEARQLHSHSILVHIFIYVVTLICVPTRALKCLSKSISCRFFYGT